MDPWQKSFRLLPRRDVPDPLGEHARLTVAGAALVKMRRELMDFHELLMGACMIRMSLQPDVVAPTEGLVPSRAMHHCYPGCGSMDN